MELQFHDSFIFCLLYIESTGPPDVVPPVDVTITEDPIGTSNFTRSDANCDKTGTCYDGKIIVIDENWMNRKISANTSVLPIANNILLFENNTLVEIARFFLSLLIFFSLFSLSRSCCTLQRHTHRCTSPN